MKCRRMLRYTEAEADVLLSGSEMPQNAAIHDEFFLHAMLEHQAIVAAEVDPMHDRMLVLGATQGLAGIWPAADILEGVCFRDWLDDDVSKAFFPWLIRQVIRVANGESEGNMECPVVVISSFLSVFVRIFGAQRPSLDPVPRGSTQYSVKQVS